MCFLRNYPIVVVHILVINFKHALLQGIVILRIVKPLNDLFKSEQTSGGVSDVLCLSAEEYVVHKRKLGVHRNECA